MSKLAMVSKILADKVKRRLIVDCLRSGANDVAKQWERILLPQGS